MVIFNSYAKLPEGINEGFPLAMLDYRRILLSSVKCRISWVEGFLSENHDMSPPKKGGFEQNSLPEVYQGLHRFSHNPEILVVIISITVMAL